MANNKQQIRIDSILGGHASLLYLPKEGEYSSSIAIDPDQGPGATITPVMSRGTGETPYSGVPLWVIPTPKTSHYFVYDSRGSVYSISGSNITGVGDLNDGGTATGNGAAYNDNYVYFSRDTTIARYGPLNGTASFTDDYWVGTLGKTALTNTTYPTPFYGNIARPNHFLHRHTDGRLYIADVVGNQGTIHFIRTTKTSVEGDTDDGSTYNALDLPYGNYPICMTSYGEYIAIAVFEGNTSGSGYGRTKLVLWDGTSDSPERIIDLPFGDRLISAMLNVNGVLYVWSGTDQAPFVRISRYIGGDSFEQLAYLDDSLPPWPGAVDHTLTRIFFGGQLDTYENNTTVPMVMTLGLNKAGGTGIYSVKGLSSTSASEITALKVLDTEYNATLSIQWANGTSGFTEDKGTNDQGYYPTWVSGIYNIGQPFKITKVTLYSEFSLGSTTNSFIPKIITDLNSYSGSSQGIPEISFANYGTAKKFVFRPINATGNNQFVLQIEFTVNSNTSFTTLRSIRLPILIEYELIDDN